MILGLDVGGTQTDAVLIHQGEIVAEVKTPTEEDLIETLRASLQVVAGDVDSGRIERLAFSTTMVTNAIVQDRLAAAGMIVTAGPGMDPRWFAVGPCYQVLEGCLDHRGFEVRPLDRPAVLEAAARIRTEGIGNLGIVGKFSVRNPLHELQIAEWAGGDFSHFALGHKVSGILNFPRRISTTYLNAALYDVHHRFTSSLAGTLDERGLKAPRYLLKPDGGTVELDRSIHYPARTAQSGPAASVMGALALDGCRDTSLVLDIGGTTTDISVVLNGLPLIEPHGIRLGPYQTLIRSLLTRSVGIGGDSEVRRGEGTELLVGPLRQGPPRALGGPAPTPTDAMITLGLIDLGDRGAAAEAMKDLGGPSGWGPEAAALRVLERTADIIASSVRDFLDYINTRPVYTIHEVLHEERISPTSAVIIGGPALELGPYVGKALGLPFRVPPHWGVANAVGAAVSRVTSEITLQADTTRGTVVIPEAGIEKRIHGRFEPEDALSLAREVLLNRAVEAGADPDTIKLSLLEKQVFNMIRGFSRTGQNIRIRMGVTPGLIPEWKRRQRQC